MNLNEAHNAAKPYVDGAYYETLKVLSYRKEMKPEVADVVLRHPSVMETIAELVSDKFTFGVEDRSRNRKRYFYAQKPTGGENLPDAKEAVKISSIVVAEKHPSLPRQIKTIVRNLVEYGFCENLKEGELYDHIVTLNDLIFYTTKSVAKSISRIQAMSFAMAIKEGLESVQSVTINLEPYTFTVSTTEISVDGKTLFITK